MKSLRGRLTVTFMALMGLSVLITGMIVATLMRAAYIDALTERMEKEGIMLAETLNWDTTAPGKPDFRRQARLFGKTLGTKVTLIDVSGRVLGDSHRNPAELGDMKRYPEIKRVLEEKEEGTFEEVRSQRRLDVFIPVERNGDRKGAVQLTLELDSINDSLRKVWVTLVAGSILAFGVAAIVSSKLANRITRPLEEIADVAVDIARNKYHRRIPVRKRDEIGRLATAINRMAAGLHYQVETIRKSERRLTGVIETMENGLLMIDAEERIILANQAIEHIFNIKPSLLLNKPFPDRSFLHEIRGLIYPSLKEGQRTKQEVHLYVPQERILEVNVTPIWGEKGERGVVMVFHDITSMRHLEQLRTEFVANVSHELKTPVTSLRGFAETLLEGAVEKPETQREFLQIILHESIRLERLISDLLELSKIESRKVRIELETVSFIRLITPIIKTMEEELRKRELSVHLDGKKDRNVVVDRDRFSQIVINLLSNAMAYTSTGGKIHIDVGADETEWWLTVSDTGIGIPEEDLPRIFERFYRVDKARTRDSGGTGLGLAIVKHLVEAHDGRIEVESEVGVGTTFRAYFPRLEKG